LVFLFCGDSIIPNVIFYGIFLVHFHFTINRIYKLVKTLNFEIYRELTRNQYQVNGAEETQIEFLIQDPNGYLLRFTN